MKIKAIFFDFDGTLRHSVPGGGVTSSEYIRSLGVEFSDKDFHRAMRWEFSYWANSTDLNADLEANNGENEGFWVNYSYRQLLALGVSHRQSKALAPKVLAYMQEFYTPRSIVPPDVQNALEELKERGYFMAVISNRTQPFGEELAAHGIGDFFNFTLAGGEVDSYKPQPEIFGHALQRAKALPEQTAYVGDNYYADVVGSRRAGLQPVLYDPSRFFPEADCPVIRSFDELISTIESF